MEINIFQSGEATSENVIFHDQKWNKIDLTLNLTKFSILFLFYAFVSFF